MNATVFTGDLIGSREATTEAVEDSLAALSVAASRAGQRLGTDLRFTRHRGDGWQILLTQPRQTLFLCLALLAGLRAADTGLDTRIGIGIDRIESPGTRDLSDAAGPAFVMAGDMLHALGAPRRKELVLLGGGGAQPWHNAVVALVDWIARGWTPEQAEALSLVLLETGQDTNAKRAERLGISRQAFESRLKGTGHDALAVARSAFEAHDFEGTP